LIYRFFDIPSSTFSLYPDQKDDPWQTKCQHQCSGYCSDNLTVARVCRENTQATPWPFLSVYEMLVNRFMISTLCQRIRIDVGLRWSQHGSFPPEIVTNDTTIEFPLSSYSNYAIAAEFLSNPATTQTSACLI
jgi:hypothetical protein